IIPVTLTVNAGTISATPASLTFNQGAGAPPPAPQTVTVSVSPLSLAYTISVSTTTGGSWLAAAPLAVGGTSSAVQVSILNNTLPAGQYDGTVTLTAANATGSPVRIAVRLNVGTPQPLTVSPSSLSFTYVVGTSAPATQTVSVTTTGGAIPYTA